MRKVIISTVATMLTLSMIWIGGCNKDHSPIDPSETSTYSKTGGGSGGNIISGGGGNPNTGQSGTTLSAVVTGACVSDCDWSVSISCDATQIPGPIPSGGCATVPVTVQVTKTCASSVITGEVCVSNGGAVPTEDLRIELVLYRKENCTSGGYSVVAQTQLITPNQQLAAGQSSCFAYTFTGFDAGCHYKVTANVTITNHSGHLASAFGPSPSSPSIESCTTKDDCAELVDNCIPPPGFAPPVGTQGSTVITESATLSYTLQLCNQAAACDLYESVSSQVTLTECDSRSLHTTTCSVPINTPPCPTECTRTIGYWKTHAGFTGNNPDVLSQYLPIWLGDAAGPKSKLVTSAAQGVNLLNRQGVSSNGINKLYSQLLAAKLNIAVGTDNSCISAILAAADGFLATMDDGDWSGLSQQQRQQVNSWMSTLDQYNNGLLCAPHCE